MTGRPGLPEGPYVVVDADVCRAAGRTPQDVARAAAHARVGVVQVRAKDAGARDVVAMTLAVADALRGSRTLLVVDDRADVAAAARARGAVVDGVHVGRRDLHPDDVRSILGPAALIGLSAARPEHLRDVPASVDYIGSGPVRLTPTKPDATDAIGVDGVAAAVLATELPVVAIGGLSVADVPDLRAAGAHGIAVVSEVCAAPDPVQAAAALVVAWRAASGRREPVLGTGRSLGARA
ncbi:thiamine phosphate synthase [Cellulomonas sp.]|uniref:thiamine phosphate synthase n=1 Tax=Cellulomonas sp. TaxID=40001 RepID=UPI001B13A420|nr:thiamine phosphate synthase [Cellulomonas sp.]MBO9556646.1 thiamine phosphate synthase [Cellulomonas sp.]